MRISDWSSDVCSSDLVTMKPQVREIALNDGEAWFQVAKDRARLFVVEVGDVRVRAVCTAFGVKRTAGGVDVHVPEGVVEARRVGDEGNIQCIAAGSRGFVARAARKSVGSGKDVSVRV